MPSPPSLVPRPATLADVEGIVDVFMAAFNDDDMVVLFPPDGSGQAWVRKGFTGFLDDTAKAQESEVWVMRNEQDVVKSVALFWIIKPEDGGSLHWTKRWPAAVPGMDDEGLDAFFAAMSSQHGKIMGSREHIYLEIVMTHEDSRNRGLASALLRHGNELADARGYEMYLDAAKDAVRLYEGVGYVRRTDVEQKSYMAPMVRPKAAA